MPAPSEGDPDCKQLPGRDRSFGIFLDMPSILPVSATTEVSSLLTRMDSITGLSARVCGLTYLQTNPEVIASSTIEQRCPGISCCGDAKWEMRLMTTEEKSAMKAACVQAAATLIAARDSGKGQIDVDECITLAALIYVRVVAVDWRGPA
jgi:hypothetical protein